MDHNYIMTGMHPNSTIVHIIPPNNGYQISPAGLIHVPETAVQMPSHTNDTSGFHFDFGNNSAIHTRSEINLEQNATHGQVNFNNNSYHVSLNSPLTDHSTIGGLIQGSFPNKQTEMQIGFNYVF